VDRNIATEEPPAVERDYATALGSLLRGRSVRIPSRELSRPVRSRSEGFEALRTGGILDRRRYRVYRAGHIALYSSFRVDDPTDSSTDKRLGRSTDIKRESR
jgi:hypothetical protein